MKTWSRIRYHWLKTATPFLTPTCTSSSPKYNNKSIDCTFQLPTLTSGIGIVTETVNLQYNGIWRQSHLLPVSASTVMVSPALPIKPLPCMQRTLNKNWIVNKPIPVSFSSFGVYVLRCRTGTSGTKVLVSSTCDPKNCTFAWTLSVSLCW